MSNRLGGFQGTAYTGTNANQPPNVNFEDRAPTRYDFRSLGDLWLDLSTGDYYYLASLDGDTQSKGEIAHWVLIGSFLGDLQNLTTQDAVVVHPQAGTINVVGDGVSITTTGNDVTGTVTISAIGGAILDTIVSNAGIINPVPSTIGILGGANMTTRVSGTNLFMDLIPDVVIPTAGSLTLEDPTYAQGVVQTDVNGTLFADNGPQGTFLIGGNGAGQPPKWGTITTNTPTELVITDGYTGGGDPYINIDFGGTAAASFRTDSGAGNDAVPSAGRVDILGTANQIATSSPGGAPGRTVTVGLATNVTVPGTLTVPNLVGPGFVRASAGGLMSVLSDSVNNGYVIISSAVGAPAWAALTSTGGSVTITRGPNTINLESGGGGGGLTTLNNDGGTFATVAAGALNLFGDGQTIDVTGDNVNTATVAIQTSPNITGTVTASTGFTATTGDITIATGDLTVTLGTINLPALGEGVMYVDNTNAVTTITNGTNGQVLIGKTGDVPLWANITSTGGSVTITNGPNSINLEAAGVAAVTALTTDTGDATPTGGKINVLGGLNINTDNLVANTVTINLDKSIAQPDTNNTATEGMYSLGGLTFMHNYSPAGDSTFLGQNAGNLTLTTAANNTGVGAGSLSSLTTGSNNVSLQGGFFLTTGSDNIILGNNAGALYNGAQSSNIVIGNAGNALDNNTIRIGTQGAGAGQQNVAYMAGIYGATAPAANAVVFVDANGKLGTPAGGTTNGAILIGGTNGPQWQTITAGAGITVTNTDHAITITNTGGGGGGGAQNFLTQSGTAIAGSIVPGRIVINGGENVNTTGATDTVVVNLNRSISWPPTAVNAGTPGGYEGIIFLNSLLFMSARGTRNTFLGESAGNLTLTTGSATDNVGIGANVLTSVTTGQQNVGVGSGNFQALTTSSNNTAVGFNAGASITSGANNNTLIGHAAGDSITNGDRNTAVGKDALQAATGSSDGTALGYRALQSQSSGTRNLAAGANAGGAVTTIDDVVLLGYNAAVSLSTSGSGTVAIGSGAAANLLTTNITGNTVIGFEAMNDAQNNTAFNTILGYQAYDFQTVGSNNLVAGYQAFRGGGLGDFQGCVALGSQAGENSGTNITNSVMIGYRAGRAVVAGGGGNVLIGANAGSGAGVFGENVIIGSSAGSNYSAGSSTNNIIIKNAGGVAGENNKIRIGTQGSQSDAYMAGIYNSAIATSNFHPVYVDSTGKLGKQGSDYTAAVAAYLATSAGNVTGNGTIYYLTGLTEIRDNRGVFNAATGTYTAPVSGLYQCMVSFTVSNYIPPAPPPPPPPPIRGNQCPLYIVTTARSYQLADTMFGSGSTDPGQYETRQMSALAQLSAGDTVRFAIEITLPTPSLTIDVWGTDATGTVIPQGLGTYCSVYLVQEF